MGLHGALAREGLPFRRSASRSTVRRTLSVTRTDSQPSEAGDARLDRAMILTLSSPLSTETSLTINVGDSSSASSNFSPETSPARTSMIFMSNPKVSRQRRASIRGRSNEGEGATLEVYSVRAPEQATRATAATPIHGETGWGRPGRTSETRLATSALIPHLLEPGSGGASSRFSNQWWA